MKNKFLPTIGRWSAVAGLCLYLSIGGYAAPLADTAILQTDCGVLQGDYTNMSSAANITFTGGNTASGTPLKTVDNDFLIGKGIAGSAVRVFVAPATVQSSGLSNYDNYVKDASRVAGAVLMVISGPTQVGTGSQFSDTATYRSLVRQILSHYKALAPNITYIEAVNEYDLLSPVVGDSAYYAIYYKMICQEVNRLNAGLAPGSIPLQVGGPCTSSWKSSKIQNFINHYAADRDTVNKRLDFISYHDYCAWNTTGETKTGQLVKLGTRRSTLEGWLSAKGLSTDIPLLVTEQGIFPGNKLRESGSPYNLASGDWLLMQAASIATYNYYYSVTGNGKIQAYTWDTRLDPNPEKSLFAPYPLVGTNKFTPFGNTITAMTLMGATRVQSPAPVIDTATGFGVYELTTVDSNRITAMVWNWQHLNQTTEAVNLKFTNLPAAFQGKKIQMVRRLIDSQHSNYFFDSSRADLQIVDTVTNFNPGGYSLVLQPNVVTLLTLTPLPCAGGDSLAMGHAMGGKIIVYPNPAKNNILVMIKGGIPDQRVTIRLYSQQGELLLEKYMTNNPERINISRYAKGVYYVRVSSGRGMPDIQKIIIR